MNILYSVALPNLTEHFNLDHTLHTAVSANILYSAAHLNVLPSFERATACAHSTMSANILYSVARFRTIPLISRRSPRAPTPPRTRIFYICARIFYIPMHGIGGGGSNKLHPL